MASVDVLSGMFPDKQQDFVLSINETDIAIVKQLAPGTEKAELLQTAQTIEQTLRSELFVKTVIGISTVAGHLRELADAYKEAQVAIEVGKVFETEKTIINYENLGIGRLIYQLPTTLCEIFLSEVFKKNTIEARFLPHIKAALRDLFSTDLEVKILDDQQLAAYRSSMGLPPKS